MESRNSARFAFVFIAFLATLTGIECKSVKNDEYTPIVMWHGMGDSCCFSFSLGSIAKSLNESLPGVYVHSLRIGNNVIEDVTNGYFMHPDKQIEMACDLVKKDPLLQNGFNAIGFSQGGQFLRALVQRCPDIKMKNLISVGGQHQGVYGVPQCGSLNHTLCDYIRKLLSHAAYIEWVQDFLVQATYWHDPLHEAEYKNASTFLADINNEVTINQDYIDRLDTLENLVMIKFEKDTMVQPVDSEWFGFYKPGQSEVVENLQESDIYQDERLGLRSMDENGKLRFLSVDGNHLRFEWDWFEENVVYQFLN